MQITFTRIVIPFIGITFGFFIGCSTLSTNNNKTAQPAELTKEELQAEINDADRQIQNGPENADLYYHKGYLLSQYAQQLEEPAERTPTYRELRQTLDKSEELFIKANLPSGKQKVDDLLKVTWSSEHNLGVQIMQSDSTLESRDYNKAATHFNNATVILPDTAISYKMEARAYYKGGKNDRALNALEEASNQIEDLPTEMLEQMAFLYLETGQPQKAVTVYEEAESFTDNNLNIIHGLANAYIAADEHQKAVTILESLVENEPDNIIYAQTLATEYYHLGSVKLLEVVSSDDSGNEQEILAKADSLFDSARNQFERIVGQNSGNTKLQETFARFCQNTAARYQKVLPETGSEHNDGIREKVRDYLSTSLPVYENLARQNPDADEYWKNLYQVYTHLGMNEKAEEAKSKIN